MPIFQRRLRFYLPALLAKLHHYYLVPLAVLGIGLTITYAVWQNEQKVAKQTLQTRFEFRVRETTALIEERMRVYQQVMTGIQSFFSASQNVNHAEFHQFTHKLLQEKNYIGIKALGFSSYVQHHQKNQHIAAIKSEWLNSYSIYPETVRDSYAPITYIEPNSAENLRAVGFDSFTDMKRRMTMETARDLNTIAVSPKVTLIQELGQPYQHPSFLMFLPVYRNELPHDTVEQRKQHLKGWIYTAFVADELFREMLWNTPDDIDIEIYDNSGVSADSILFDRGHTLQDNTTSNALFQLTKDIEISGHHWTVVMHSLPGFESKLDQNKSQQVAFYGTAISLLLSVLVWLLINRVRTSRELRQTNQSLSDSEQRWKFALEGSGDGVWDWDISSDTVLYSKRWKEMLGFSEDEVGNELNEWTGRLHPDDRPTVMKDLHAYFAGESANYLSEHRVRCKDNSWKWIMDRGMIVSRDSEGKPTRMVGTHTDISILKASEELIWKQANFDVLTGLPNRRMLHEHLGQEIKKSNRSGLPLALISLDLDRFKEVNDSLGHDSGDILLKETAKRLQDCVRDTDVVSRLGGDEFIIILADLHDTHIVERIASKILCTLIEPFKLDTERAYISGSLGITFYPSDAPTIEELLKNVDQAMYASKNQGKNRFTYFTPAMHESAKARMLLTKELRDALAKQQFEVYYQPIVNLHDGSIKKAEALIRWIHPEQGIISPAHFIPIAEDTGLIIDIGDWVFKQAVSQVIEWRQTIDADFQVSINKSPVQFHNDNGTHQPWFDYLKQKALPGDALVVEITEGLLLDANDKVISTLLQFSDFGIHIALDDFGTGYSSLSYLKKFDIDYIKIDKSFINNLSSKSDDMALCEAIIGMSHKLGLKVIAEGVETTSQCDLLTAAGCDFGQGYLFSRPLPALEFEKRFAPKPERTLTRLNK